MDEPWITVVCSIARPLYIIWWNACIELAVLKEKQCNLYWYFARYSSLMHAGARREPRQRAVSQDAAEIVSRARRNGRRTKKNKKKDTKNRMSDGYHPRPSLKKVYAANTCWKTSKQICILSNLFILCLRVNIAIVGDIAGGCLPVGVAAWQHESWNEIQQHFLLRKPIDRSQSTGYGDIPALAYFTHSSSTGSIVGRICVACYGVFILHQPRGRCIDCRYGWLVRLSA